MAGTIRLDKYLTDMGIGTRSCVKEFIRKNRVMVNGTLIKDSSIKIDINSDNIFLDGERITYVEYEYIMLNKPAGVITATSDKREKTIMELIKDKKRKDMFPVGRLDKDTEGLLLITNDGELAHNLLAPGKHIEKTYFATVLGKVTQDDVSAFTKGLQVDDDFLAMPAKLCILNNYLKDSKELSDIEITIEEGKYHQIKRMFEAVDKKVIYLKRISMGSLKLDDRLALGEYRRLSKEEIDILIDR